MSDLKPFLKWAGGKRQLLPELIKRIPVDKLRTGELTYYEPFVGAGAVLFEVKPKYAIIGDINWDLINCYQVIQNQAQDLIRILNYYKNNHSEEFFYKIRGMDRDSNFLELDEKFRAARIIYLNKTCFNGLYRVNSKGQFNVPFGKYKNPLICDENNLLRVSDYLNVRANVTCWHLDFEQTLETTHPDSFVYLDPPYDPVTDTASFTSYSVDGFDQNEQLRLRKCVDELHKKGCRFLLSNSDTPFINRLYQNYKIEKIEATRNINSKGTGRGKINEVLISNY